jgi:hypothetical protein
MAKRQKGQECLNCNATLNDANYCSDCGQLNDTRRLSFWELVGESLSNFLAIDGRIFRTLKEAAFKPGQVAINFRKGQRTRYMNPVRFYFLASVLLIASLQLNRTNSAFVNSSEIEGSAQLEEMNPLERSAALSDIRASFLSKEQNIRGAFSAMSKYLAISPKSSRSEVFLNLGISEGFWYEFAFAQAQKTAGFSRNQDDNFKAFNQALLSRLFWILFLYIPLLGFILNLIYFRQDIYYPEHLFFTLYQQGFFFLLSFVYNLLVQNERLFPILIMLYALHLLFAMKRFYNQSWGRTIFKFMLVNFFGVISFTAFFLLALILVFILL